MTAASMGGDRRSGATEAYGPRVLALLEAQPDLTLDEICAALGPAGAAPSWDTKSAVKSGFGTARGMH